MSWRPGKITQLFSKITQSAKAVKPDLTISLATNPYQFAYTEYLQDWLTWVEEGLVDELILQVYRDDIGSFSTELSVVKFPPVLLS